MKKNLKLKLGIEPSLQLDRSESNQFSHINFLDVRVKSNDVFNNIKREKFRPLNSGQILENRMKLMG